MKTRLAVSVLLLIAFASIAAFYVQAQSSSPSGPVQLLRSPPWPPSPDNIFNLADSAVSFAAGERKSVFAVPADTWLVITDAAAFSATNITLAEHDLTSNHDTLKIPEPILRADYGWHLPPLSNSYGLGLTFRPGTQVMLQNTGTESVNVNFFFLGYFVR